MRRRFGIRSEAGGRQLGAKAGSRREWTWRLDGSAACAFPAGRTDPHSHRIPTRTSRSKAQIANWRLIKAISYDRSKLPSRLTSAGRDRHRQGFEIIEGVQQLARSIHPAGGRCRRTARGRVLPTAWRRDAATASAGSTAGQWDPRCTGEACGGRRGLASVVSKEVVLGQSGGGRLAAEG